MPFCITETYIFAPKKYTSSLVSYTEIVSKTPQEMRDPLTFRSFRWTHTCLNWRFCNNGHRSTTTTALTIISKMGRLTFPISGYQRYGFPCTTRITSSRNSWISLIPCYYRNPVTIRIPGRLISNLHPTLTSWTNGCLWIVLALRKHWRHQQNRGVIRTQSIDATNMVLFWTLSMDCKGIGERSTISKG